MPNIAGVSLNDLLSAPLLLGGATALFAVLLVLAFARAGVARRLLVPVAVLIVVGLGVTAVLDRMTQDARAAERRAFRERAAQLTAQALAPGSALACLDGVAGDAVENACERAVFAGPRTTAAAVAYMAARLTLLADALSFARRDDPDFAANFAGLRRAIELDRFGIAAHVLASRDGCTAERCAAFALLKDADVIKSNLKAQIFDQYVSRHAGGWNKGEPKAATEKEPMAAAPATAGAPVARTAEPAGTREKTPLAKGYDFPSAASIPPVSIMNAEPPLAKEATDAHAAQTSTDSPAAVPVPEKRRPPKREPAPPLPLR
jgi:hypothetical protein